MPFLCPSWPPKLPEITARISELMESGDWGRYKTPHQDALRSRLSDLCGTKHVRLCGSGSSAVELALRGAGIGSGDEVIVAAYDYPGNFRAIESVGAKPVLVDVAPQKATIDIDQVAQLAKQSARSRPETTTASGKNGTIRAVIASHLYGTAAPASELREICDQNNWCFIEDACQAPGMKINDVPVGSFGSIATLSFGGSKPLTSGCGGAIVSDDDRVAARLRAMLDRPSDSQPLSALQAATLLPQLDRLAEFNARRQATVQFLESEVNPRLKNWTRLSDWKWLSQSDATVSATHYKVAWTIDASEKRAQLLQACVDQGLPMGEGFRSSAGCSERRCKKPFSLERAQQLGESLVVLDHTALLLMPDRYTELSAAMQAAASA